MNEILFTIILSLNGQTIALDGGYKLNDCHYLVKSRQIGECHRIVSKETKDAQCLSTPSKATVCISNIKE